MNVTLHELRVSVIVPCWGDGDLIGSRLECLWNCPGIHEILVVDVSPAKFVSSDCRVVVSPEPNRGLQLDLGARAAVGDVLLFLHSDTEFHPAHAHSLLAALRDPEVVGGAFYRKFDERHPGLMWLEPFERLHSKWFGTIYGDQSLFVRRTHYEKIGGFRDFPLLEDVEFSGRFRRSGKVVIVDPPVRTSPRRHLAQGPWRTTLRNLLFLLLYRAGVSPRRIHSWYYSRRVNTETAKSTAVSLTTTP